MTQPTTTSPRRMVPLLMVFILVIMMTVLSSSVYSLTEGHGVAIDATQTFNGETGLYITVLAGFNLNVTAVTKSSVEAGTRLRIYNASNKAEIYSGTGFTDNIHTLSAPLLLYGTNSYWVLNSKSDCGSRDNAHKPNGGGYSNPINTTPHIRWDSAVYLNTCGNTGTNTSTSFDLYSYESITFEALELVSLFKITAKNIYNNSALLAFNATVNGTFYSTTNGTITTTISPESAELVDIFAQTPTYYDLTLTHNVSDTLELNFYQSILRLNATEIITNDAIPTATFTSGTQSGTELFVNSGDISVTFSADGYYSLAKTFSVAPLSNASQTFTDAYHSLLNVTATSFLGASITTFSATLTLLDTAYSGYTQTLNTTTGEILLGVINGTYSVTLDAIGFALDTQNSTITTNYTELEFVLYTTNSINFTFKDEVTNALITGITVTLEFISDVFSTTRTTTNGTIFIDLLTPKTYTLRYDADGYGQRLHYLTVTNRTFTDITLFLLNETGATEVTITVFDETNQRLEGAFIYIYKYDTDTNAYLLREIVQTNFEGQAISDLVLNTEFYKFVIEYPLGIIRRTTEPTYIFSNSLVFVVNTQSEVLANYFNSLSIASLLSFNNATNNFRWEYLDSEALGSQYCLETYEFRYAGYVLLGTTCTTTSSATLLASITPVNGTTYQARTFVYYDGEKIFIEEYTQRFGVPSTSDKLGLLLAFMFLLAVVFMFRYSVVVATIMIPVPLFIMNVTGFISVDPLTVILPLQAMCIIIAYLMREF